MNFWKNWPFGREFDVEEETAEVVTSKEDEDEDELVFIIEAGNPIREARGIIDMGEQGVGVQVKAHEHGRYYILLPNGKIKDSEVMTWEKIKTLKGLPE